MLLWVFNGVKFWGGSQQLKGVRNTVWILILAVKRPFQKDGIDQKKNVLTEHFFSLTSKSLNILEGEEKGGD